jgi:ribosomal protein S12 methylthiotransferase accessory factor
MTETIEVTFPAGMQVNARIGDMFIKTDQKVESGGRGTAPEPFQLFLVSIATCAGIYALDFCRNRELSTEGMTLTMDCEFDAKGCTCRKLRIHLKLPPGFPENYRRPIERVMDLCSVKKHIMNPPEFEIKAS